MATSTIYTFLMKGTTSASTTTWAKLVDIKSFPQLGGDPEQIPVTTLSDSVHKYEPGVQDIGAMQFTANFDKTDYATLKALEGTDNEFAIWFGATVSGATVTPDGSKGKFKFTGKLTVYVNGGGVNDPVDMNITIMPSSMPVEDN